MMLQILLLLIRLVFLLAKKFWKFIILIVIVKLFPCSSPFEILDIWREVLKTMYGE